jgi:hypothetical protein
MNFSLLSLYIYIYIRKDMKVIVVIMLARDAASGN